ncbi:MFS transporter [Streptomyces sp. NPDC017949]|uniref:MFS transporter n=1 Tax=Streptomyces sp. NPDC017949 TaxID=3365020 RepID=UPI0037908371
MPPRTRVGRPWGPLQGDTVEINEIATLLRGWIDEAAINVKALHAKLTDDHFPLRNGADPKAPRVPQQGKMYDFLNGKTLTREMAEAVIDVTTGESAVQTARLTQVGELFRKIDDAPTPVVVPGTVQAELQKARKGLARAQGEIETLRHAQRLSDQARSEAQDVATRMYVQLNDMRNRIESLTRERDRLRSQVVLQLASPPAHQAELNALQQRLERAQRNEAATAETLRRAEEDGRAARRVAEEATRLLMEKEKELTRLREQAPETIVAEEAPPQDEARADEPQVQTLPEYDIDVEDTAALEVEIAQERLARGRDAKDRASKDIGLFPDHIPGVVVPPGDEELSPTTPDNPPTGQNDPMPPPAPTVPPATGRDHQEPTRPSDPDAEPEPRPSSNRRRKRLPSGYELVEERNRRLAMTVIHAAVLLASFSASGALLTLPQIRDGMSLTPNGTQWVIAGDLAGLAAGLLWSHPAQARSTRKRLFLIGVLALTAGSVLAVPPWGPGATWMAAGRVLQGLGQALLLSSLLPLLETVRNGRTANGRTIGAGFRSDVWTPCTTAFVAAGTATGLAAGLTAQQWGWQWVFHGPAWLGGALLIAGFFFLPPDPWTKPTAAVGIGPFAIRVQHMTSVNLRVTALYLAGLLAVTAGIGLLVTHPWYSLPVLVPVAAGWYAMVKAATWDEDDDSRYSPPSPPPSPSERLAALLGAQVLYVAPVYLVLYLYEALRYDVLSTAALMCAVLVPQPAAGWVARRLTLHGRLIVRTVGLLCAGSGVLLVSGVGPVGAGLWDVLMPLILVGVGSTAIRMGQSPSSTVFPQQLWKTACASGALGIAGAAVLVDRVAAGHGDTTATQQQLLAQTYGEVLFATAVCAGIAAVIVAALPAASGAEPRALPTFVDSLADLLEGAVVLCVALLPAYMAAVTTSAFRHALSADPKPDLSFLILYVLLGLTALALTAYVLHVKIVRFRSEATSGKEWTRYTDVLTGTVAVGAGAGIPLGAFGSLGLFTAPGAWLADLVGLV